MAKYRRVIAELALDIIASGGTLQEAADALDVTVGTLFRWAERGKEPNAPKHLRSFSELFDAARALKKGKPIPTTPKPPSSDPAEALNDNGE